MMTSAADERCHELERAFECALGRVPMLSRFIRLAGRCVELRFAGPALCALAEAFGHLRAIPGEAELTIYLADSESTGTTPALVQLSAGSSAGAPAGTARFAWETSSNSVHCLESSRRRAFFWTRSRAGLEPWNIAAPLRLLLAWWAESLGAQLAHGAVVGHAGSGILLAGPGGAGKSTLTLACIEAGLACLGDDYVWIEPGDPATAFSLYSTVKLEQAALWQHFAALAPQARALGGPKATLFLAELPGREPPLPGMPIHAVAALRRSGHVLPRVRDATSIEVLAALAPSSLLQIPGSAASGLRRLAELVRVTRRLVFEAGTDHVANALAIAMTVAPPAASAKPAMNRGAPPGARVSVIIAVHDGAGYLAEALSSVFAQRRPADEVIVVDDGSTDGSAELACSFPAVRCLKQEHAGQASALNRGVAAASGDFLAFLDADDRWLPDKLALQLDAFAGNPELDLVFGHTRQFFQPGMASARTGQARILPARLPSALLVRRAAFYAVGAFSSEWPIGGVIEWCTRAVDQGLREHMLSDVVYERRVHGKNLGLSRPAAAEYARMLKSVLDRRRSLLAQAPPPSHPRERQSPAGRGGAS